MVKFMVPPKSIL